jgi:hypothetical protein
VEIAVFLEYPADVNYVREENLSLTSELNRKPGGKPETGVFSERLVLVESRRGAEVGGDEEEKHSAIRTDATRLGHVRSVGDLVSIRSIRKTEE